VLHPAVLALLLALLGTRAVAACCLFGTEATVSEVKAPSLGSRDWPSDQPRLALLVVGQTLVVEEVGLQA